MSHADGTSDSTPSRSILWASAGVILVADIVTKYLAHTRLPLHVPHEVLGEFARLTLSYNPGAAFGMNVGAASRVVFIVLTVVVLGFLWRLYREGERASRLRGLAFGLVAGGAVGNLVNRLWSERGVVDFLDIGVGDVRFWTFNVADIGVSIGAVLLVWVLSREGAVEAHPSAAAGGDLRSDVPPMGSSAGPMQTPPDRA